MLSLIVKSFIHLHKQLAFSFQQKAIVLVLVAKATYFQHKLNCVDKFYKPVEFQAIEPEFILILLLNFSIVFRDAAMTSYLTSFKPE